MVTVFDRAQQREQEDRDRAIADQIRKGRITEQPDEVDGIRYCLDCGDEIDPARLSARPEAVRCVECQQFKDERSKR